MNDSNRPGGFRGQKQRDMKTYRFSIATVKVIDCANDIVDFRVAEVYDTTGKFVHEIRTTTKDKKAAELAFHDALRCRLI